MSHLGPTTLTADEQTLILRATTPLRGDLQAANPETTSEKKCYRAVGLNESFGTALQVSCR
jgi:hypothetical protein